MSCIAVAATVLNLAWCAATGPVDHYKVYRDDQPTAPLMVVDDTVTKVTIPCICDGAHSYYVVAHNAADEPVEWVQGPSTLPIVCTGDEGLDADGSGFIGSPDFACFGAAFTCTTEWPEPEECL